MRQRTDPLQDYLRRPTRRRLAKVVQTYHRLVWNAAYRCTRNGDDAEEICQEAFLKAFASLDSFDFEPMLTVSGRPFDELLKGHLSRPIDRMGALGVWQCGRRKVGYNRMTMSMGSKSSRAADGLSRNEEQRLIHSAQRQDMAAARRLIDLHKDRLYAFVSRTARNHHDDLATVRLQRLQAVVSECDIVATRGVATQRPSLLLPELDSFGHPHRA